MKSLLIVCAVIGAAYAGSRDLDAGASRKDLSNYERLCASGRVPESGALVELDGVKTWVYCKSSKNNKVIDRDEQKTFNVDSIPQTVFLKPGDLKLNQRVTVTGNVRGSKTRIYYVPSNVDSDVTVNVEAVTNPPEKPSVIFLSKQDGSAARSGSSRRSGNRRDDAFGFGDE